MRVKKRIGEAAIGVGSTAVLLLAIVPVVTGDIARAQVFRNLRGSDVFEDVFREMVALCPGATGLNLIGGGSSGGQNAMIAEPPLQQIAPMSRELNSTACDATKGAQQLLVGLDVVAIVGANQIAGDCLETPVDGANEPADDCRDAIQGGRSVAVADCSVVGTACDNGQVSGPGTYTFTGWKDALAMLYGGQNHASGQLLSANRTRNSARIDCAGQVRQALVNNWGTLFSDTGAAEMCRTGTCNRLKHAFRLDDRWAATETFVGLVGMVAIPAFTITFANNFPTTGTFGTANPFCNAGEAIMTKGDSDYLDLDPIRRIADSEGVLPDNRAGREQVAEGYGPPANPPAVLGNDTRPDPPVTVLADLGASNRQNVGPDPNNPGWPASQQSELPKRRGLGVVLSISLPANFKTPDVAYWAPTGAGGAPVLCTPGVLAPTLPDTAPPGICPDGTVGLCNLPVNAADPSAPNFNCMSVGAKPSSLPIQDQRAYNLLVLTPSGKYVYDDYFNPSISLPAIRQRRVVSAFYRLHATRTTNFAGTPTGGPCPFLTSAAALIGCLVKANPCSIGYDARDAVDNSQNMAFRLGTLPALDDAFAPSIPRIDNLLSTATLTDNYPLARALWMNAYVGLANVSPGNERDLLACMGYGGPTANIDNAMATHHFTPVSPGTTRERNCPAAFP